MGGEQTSSPYMYNIGMKRLIFALMALLGIAACEPQPPVDPTQTLLLSVDKPIIVADGVDTATFTVTDHNKNEVNATILFADTKEAIEGNTFKTKYAGEYVFYAKYGNDISNPIGVKATEAGEEPKPEPTKKELVLNVDKATIDADGVQMATFTTTVDDVEVAATIYNAKDNSALSGKTFSTTEVGVYTFYAKYEELTSKEVKVTAKMVIVEEEKPIVLEASVTSIKANGIESATLTVTQDGGNVTSKCTIYANGSIVNGNKFATTTAGEYVIYATKGDLKSNEVTIIASAVESGTEIHFAEGVTISSGWYDVNKKGMGDNGDINMCWAAASSNMIQWWQDRYVAAGGTLPSTAVNGPGTKTYGSFGPYELALMEIYHDEWNNSKGGHPEEAIPWYFEGKLYGGEYASAGSQATPLTAGGYYNSVWSSIEPHLYRGYKHDIFPSQYPNMYTYCYNNYYLWGNGSSLQGKERLLFFSNLVVEAIDRGIASMTISLSENIASLHHAVTLWGYEIDKATGLLTRIWITDSDDLTSEPKQQLLNEYSVSIGEGKSHIKLSGNTRYGNAWIVSIHPLSGYGSANK
ncbi:MAG: IdeS/Mac family cysteine endopeptidase [Alistipes sp.]|nr:IdeS/Mac family cysteine endopeptidase [Alistipes sp.]